MTAKQKTDIAKAAPHAMGDLTDSSFWDEVRKHLERIDTKRKDDIQPRKLKNGR